MPCDDPCSHNDANDDDDEILALMMPFRGSPYFVLHGVYLVVFLTLILIRLFVCV